MPQTLGWRRLVLAAMVGAAASGSLTPTHARADELVASFVGDRRESPQGTGPLAARSPSVVGAGPETNPAVGFAPIDQGRPGLRRRVQAAHALRQALRRPLTLSTLILMVFNVPAMPSLETTTTGSVLSGSGDTGLTQETSDTGLTQETSETVSSSSSAPPTAPEPTALLSGLLGFGLTGVYTVLRRRTRRRRKPRVVSRRA